MANNKVTLSTGEVLIDLTSDTVTASNLLAGETAHDRSGNPVTGTVNLNDYVLKSGDTMTGSLHIQDRVLFVDSTCGNSIYLQAYSTGNQGIYSSGYYTDGDDPNTYTSSPAWIIRRNSVGDVYVPLWASTGSSNTPVYIDSVGKPVACGDVNRSTYTHWLEASQGRLADINFSHIYTNDKVHMRLDIASSTLVSNPFSNDGYVLTFMWDNSGAYDTQIYIPDGANGMPKMRKRLNSTWGNPVTFLTVPSGSGVGTSSRPICINASGVPTECSYDFTDYILKSGGTMTGALNLTDRGVSINSTTAARSFAIGSTSGISVAYQISAAGSQGIWSSGYASSLTDTSTYTASSKWIIYRSSSGAVYTPEWASIGSATSPVYIDSNGRPAACTSIPSSLVSGNFVTSVAVTGSKGVSISGSPITSSGTIDVSISTSSGTATRNTTNTSAGEVKYQKYGRVVTIYTTTQITVTSTGAAANKTYFSGLPKPSANVTFTGTGPSNKAVALMITTDGYLQGVFNAPPSGILTVGCTYIAAS